MGRTYESGDSPLSTRYFPAEYSSERSQTRVVYLFAAKLFFTERVMFQTFQDKYSDIRMATP